MSDFWHYSGIAFWLLLMVYLLVKRSSISKYIDSVKRIFLGRNLKKSIDDFAEEFPNEVKKKTVANLSYAVIARITRAVTIPLIISIIISLVPYYFLIQQNRLISKQNILFDSQNNLLEADRRSSLVFLMNSLLDRVDDEIKFQRNIINSHKVLESQDSTENMNNSYYQLSTALTSRIIALSRSFQPYKSLEGDTLSKNAISPERGQFFIALMSSQLDPKIQSEIAEFGDFSYAVIGRIKVDNARLDKVNLSYANLIGAEFLNSSFIEANFQYAEFTTPPRIPPYTYLIDEPQGTDFEGSIFVLTHFENATMISAGFKRTSIQMTLFTDAILKESFFDDAKLNFVHFERADLSRTSFRNAVLEDVVFKEANLHQVDFSGAKFMYGQHLYNGKKFSYMPRYDQLIHVKSLYNSQYLEKSLADSLKRDKPCLFKPSGCNEE